MWIFTNNSFLVSCPNCEKRDLALRLKILAKPGGAMYFDPWITSEHEPSPALEIESWAKVEGFPDS